MALQVKTELKSALSVHIVIVWESVWSTPHIKAQSLGFMYKSMEA